MGTVKYKFEAQDYRQGTTYQIIAVVQTRDDKSLH